ncbi:uncharacterized protein [Antennarius striatus]|uniref:uncharacterized protein n=1 Tax=Antennarius striatus TaxID=241820 RepID=UPI0035AE90EF
MEETYLMNYPGVRKKILAGGTGPMPHFPPGTKLVFHFQTLLDDFERTVIDDSRLAGQPAEIFVGKMFKMEIWETLLTSMRVDEVAEFWCDATHTGLYPIVSKGMRLIAQGKDPLEGQRHMCGMGNMFHYHSTGFPELDELMRTPQPLIFIMELLQVGDPMSYHRESWMMEKDEKLHTVPILHMQGNALVKQKRFREASTKYKEAVLLLKTVQSKEMPGDVDYINLGRMIVPLELNYCQCMLELEEYYEVIEHTTELLEKHRDCVKGYYKRAKAHAAVWNEKEARRDFNMVAHLDVTLASLASRELRVLSERMKEKYWEEKETYWNMLEKHDNKYQVEECADDGRKQTDGESVSTLKDDVGDEKGSAGCSGSNTAELLPGRISNEEEASTPDINPTVSIEAEGKDWQQMLQLVMLLQNEGNFLIKEKRFQDACDKFKEALEYMDALQNMVDPKAEDWQSLEKVRLPLTLNLSHCLLQLKQYQQVVDLNNKLLKKHKGNFKAMYQRAHAHAALCNEDEARRDFDMVQKLDPKFKPFVREEMKKLGERVRALHVCQNKTYWDATQEKWGPAGSKGKGGARNKKFSQNTVLEEAKADEKTENSKLEDNQGSEKPASADTGGEDDAGKEKIPDVVTEQCTKELERGGESGEGLENENMESLVAHNVREISSPNREEDKDKNRGPISAGEDYAASERSDNIMVEKAECQSSTAPGFVRTIESIKDTSDKTGSDDILSDSPNGLELSCADPQQNRES